MKQRNKGGGDTMYKANLQRCRSVTLCISRLVSRFFVPASFICTQCTLFELYGFCDFLCLSPFHSHTTHSTFMFIPAFLFLHNKRNSIAIRHFVSPIVWEIIDYKIVAPRRPPYVTLPPSLLFPHEKDLQYCVRKINSFVFFSLALLLSVIKINFERFLDLSFSRKNKYTLTIQ